MGRDVLLPHFGILRLISIHSPRMGRDAVSGLHGGRELYFNPLSPYGERPWEIRATAAGKRFQSTLPVWGETRQHVFGLPMRRFQSTLPVWGETIARRITLISKRISIHSPRMGRDGAGISNVVTFTHFNPLSPHGERPTSSPAPGRLSDFNPLSPHGERPVWRK